jgi:hypothetical protein
MKEINHVCRECGVTANVLTCLKKFQSRPDQLSFTVSTYHDAECDYCGEKRPVTELRDFFYPDFSLIDEVIKKL